MLGCGKHARVAKRLTYASLTYQSFGKMYLSTTQVSFLFDIMAIAIGSTITCCLTYYAAMINNLNVAYYSKLDRAMSLMIQMPLAYKRLVKKKSVHQNLLFVITLTALGLSLRFVSTLYFKFSEPIQFISSSRVTMNSISPFYNISGWTGGFTENSTSLQTVTQYLSNNNRTLLDQVVKIDKVPFVNDSSAFNSTPYARNNIGLIPEEMAENLSAFNSPYGNSSAEYTDGNTTMFATLIADENATFPYADLPMLTALQFREAEYNFWGYATYVYSSPSILLWQNTQTFYPYTTVKDSGLYAHNPTNSTLIIVSKRSAASICQPFEMVTTEMCLYHSGVSMEESFIQKCSDYLNRTGNSDSEFQENLCVNWRVDDGTYTISIIDISSYNHLIIKKLQITYSMYYSEEVPQALESEDAFTPLRYYYGMSTYTGNITFLQQLFVQNPVNTTMLSGGHEIGIFTTPFYNDLDNEPHLESLLEWFGAGCTLTGCDRGQVVLEYASGYEGTLLLIATFAALLAATCTLPLNYIKKYSLFNQHIIDTVSRTIDYSREGSVSNWNHDDYYWRLVTTSDEKHFAIAINDLGQLRVTRINEIEITESTPLNDLEA